jgi:V8-like Glu-specific endopeptidase
MERIRFEREIGQLGLLRPGDPPGVAFERQYGISGGADRSEVTDTTVPPYCWICSIAFEKDDKTLGGGTGVLISDRHVLTNRHVVDRPSGPNSPSLIVSPGRRYDAEPFGRFVASRPPRLSPNRFDFALIKLNESVPQHLKYWGHPSTASVLWDESVISQLELTRAPKQISTAGFPGAEDAYRRRMLLARGETIPLGFNVHFKHTARTTKGQSGSPIWFRDGNRLVLLGLATQIYEGTPKGLLLHGSSVRRYIDQWIADDQPKIAKPKRRFAVERPFRWVCRLEISDNSLGRVVGYGTALLITDRHVVTAASVIHAFAKDPQRYTVRVTPGYEFGHEPFEGTTASRARVAPQFDAEAKTGSAQYGLLTLERPVGRAAYSSIGNLPLGFWGGDGHSISTSVADLRKGQVRTAAFSRSSGGGGRFQALRIGGGKLIGVESGQIRHDAGNRLDAPGAPLWVEIDGRRLLVGIATGLFANGGATNLGCYLNQQARSDLMRWINEDLDRK